jgi:hypothetical protein
VGPTILLAPLLAQNYYSLYDFLNGMGARDHEPNLTVNLNWRWKREKLSIEQRAEAVITNCHAGNPNQRMFIQQTQQESTCAIRLSHQRPRSCHVINLWELENTNCI